MSLEKTIRHLEAPQTFGERLHRLRFTIFRRFTQFLVLVLFIGTARFGWSIGGNLLLSGNLSGSRLLGLVPFSDPFAALQHLLAQHWLAPETLIGAAIILLFYGLLSGRMFCAYVCPMNIVTDAAAWFRKKLGISADLVHFPAGTRYLLAAACLVLSAVSGSAAFEAFSPQAFLWREAVFGIGEGFAAAVFGVFALDLAVSRRAWCGHLCPLGAFWGTVGGAGLIKVRYDAASCTKCGDCIKVCPEPQVIHFKEAAERGFIRSGECTGCGRCITVCPEKSLTLGLRPFGKKTSN